MTLDLNDPRHNDRFNPAEHVHARRFGDEMVLVHLETGRYYGLNAIGARVWEELGAGRSVAETIERLAPAYAVERARLSADVDALMERLIGAGLIVRAEAPTGR